MDQDKVCRLGVHPSHLQVIAGGRAHQSPQVQGEQEPMVTVCKGSARQLAFLAVSFLGELSPAQHKAQALQELLYPMAPSQRQQCLRSADAEHVHIER